ncbi:zinc ABC transporter substrate-binding protein [Aliiroseovarius subalbicans]|uniref:zinc ABC transporter substrate-binding protein n=1 Tax=Aliiroseovarius subalbicans TaxID=2925840 RepID=UPI001F59C1FE|nr:zinc ABC transporter substrate-binding protein [Aliiroseovarius subalbicans]MCI2397815.1 zinc ABC transporter substrate-binding protein [Aliiroseovarius subalbicans]
MTRIALFLGLLATPTLVLADAPRVVTDIAPVQSLVAQVMEGVATPELLTDRDASPHHVQLRPSQMQALAQADLVIWVGEALTPWLERAVSGLSDATSLELLHVAGLHMPEGHHAEDGHDHDHGDLDPHAWLDPENARVWLAEIATALAQSDPENAEAYAQNAARADAALVALKAEITALLPTPAHPVVTFHQGYGHFASRFGRDIVGAITQGDAAPASAARIATLRRQLVAENVTCVFSEPQLDPALARVVTEGTGIGIGTLDPMGRDLPLGLALYGDMMRTLARNFAACDG